MSDTDVRQGATQITEEAFRALNKEVPSDSERESLLEQLGINKSGETLILGTSAKSGLFRLNMVGEEFGATQIAGNLTEARLAYWPDITGTVAVGTEVAKIDDPTDLATSITAIEAIIDALEAYGISATS